MLGNYGSDVTVDASEETRTLHVNGKSFIGRPDLRTWSLSTRSEGLIASFGVKYILAKIKQAFHASMASELINNLKLIGVFEVSKF